MYYLTRAGANDSVLPGCRQHVPLPKFKEYLSDIVSRVRNPSSQWYSPETRIVLISATPIIPADRAAASLARWKDFGSVGEPPKLDRDPAVTKQYSDACVEVAKKEGVEVVDGWNTIVAAGGGQDPEHLAPYF